MIKKLVQTLSLFHCVVTDHYLTRMSPSSQLVFCLYVFFCCMSPNIKQRQKNKGEPHGISECCY